MLKKLLGLVVGLIALFLIVPVFLPSSYVLERTIEIDKSPEVVFPQVADFNNYLTWNPWSKIEPTANNEITGNVAAVGSKWSWDGEEVGQGSLTIVEIEPNRSILSKLVFLAPMSSVGEDRWAFDSSAAGTKVTWTSSGELPYPVGRYFGLGIESMLGGPMQEGLTDLKARCESLPDPPQPPTESDEMEETESEPTDTTSL